MKMLRKCGVGLLSGIMGRMLALAFLALAVMVAGEGTGLCAAENTLRNFSLGDQLPGFSLPLMQDNRMMEFAPGKSGKPAVILFFSINPDFRKKRSLALLAELAALEERFKKKVEVIAVYSDNKDKGTVIDFAKSSAPHLPVMNDELEEVYNRYGVFMMPVVVLVSGKGKLHEVIPYTYNIREHVEGNLKLLLGEWNADQFQEAMQPKQDEAKSKEEKEYIRRVNYGRVMMERKMYAQAVREFATAVKLMPKTASGYVELGFAHLEMKEWQESEQAFKQAMTLDAESDDAVAGYGLSLYRQGKVEKALPELENALIAAEPKLDVVIALAEIYETQGNVTKAMRLNKLAVSRLMKMYEHRWKE